MAESILNQPQFQDADKAREHLEALRWPNGPVCPHCGSLRAPLKLEGKSYRPGLLKCNDCYEQFTVTVGTVFERSKIGLNVWLQAVHLMCASKKGISAKQLERMLGVTYKTAWFMAHRIREAMTSELAGPLGGSGKIVEADETYWGSEAGSKANAKKAGARRSGGALKDSNKVVALGRVNTNCAESHRV
jgi:transposase-like protein